MDEGTAKASILASRARGYMDGRTLAEVFAWPRPDDLIWNYWVNNYLQGKPPPAIEIPYWNADTTKMPAGLHRNFIEIAMANGQREVPAARSRARHLYPRPLSPAGKPRSRCGNPVDD